jgi:cytochrome b6
MKDLDIRIILLNLSEYIQGMVSQPLVKEGFPFKGNDGGDTGPTKGGGRRSFFLWLEERIELQPLVDDITTKFVPPHVNIFYCLGGLTLTCYLIQIATGFALTFYYKPAVEEAFSSVLRIEQEINFGWLIRSMHKWSASLMVAFMILHVFRVYLTGGFKAPRELTWISGLILALIVASFGVTGYTLPWDQVGYWACQIVTSVPSGLPLIGGFLTRLTRGSSYVGQATLTRFFVAHTFLLPLLCTAFMLQHFYLIRAQGISGPL